MINIINIIIINIIFLWLVFSFRPPICDHQRRPQRAQLPGVHLKFDPTWDTGIAASETGRVGQQMSHTTASPIMGAWKKTQHLSMLLEGFNLDIYFISRLSEKEEEKIVGKSK